MGIRKIILTILICITTTVCAQTKDTTLWLLPNYEFRDIGLVLGIHQFQNTFVELGISMTKSTGGCVWSSSFYGTSLSAEYNPFQNRGGLTISWWTSLATVVTVGANINSYTDFNRYNLGIKPFFGLGPGNISLTYGYNFQILNSKITDINSHCFSFRYHFTIRARN